MAYLRLPPPSIEFMLEEFADWMAKHAYAKITTTIEFRDGHKITSEVDHRGPMAGGEMTIKCSTCKERQTCEVYDGIGDRGCSGWQAVLASKEPDDIRIVCTASYGPHPPNKEPTAPENTETDSVDRPGSNTQDARGPMPEPVAWQHPLDIGRFNTANVKQLSAEWVGLYSAEQMQEAIDNTLLSSSIAADVLIKQLTSTNAQVKQAYDEELALTKAIYVNQLADVQAERDAMQAVVDAVRSYKENGNIWRPDTSPASGISIALAALDELKKDH